MVIQIEIEQTNSNVVVPKKRGRKSKKELEEMKLKEQKSNDDKNFANNITSENIVINSDNKIKNINDDNGDNNDCESKAESNNNGKCNNNDESNADDNSDLQLNSSIPQSKQMKKRGRKPKGGKIIQQIVPSNNNKETRPNVILHLKCSIKDLYNGTNSNLLLNNLESFNFGQNNNYEYLNQNKQKQTKEEMFFDYIINGNNNNNNNNNNNSVNGNNLNCNNNVNGNNNNVNGNNINGNNNENNNNSVISNNGIGNSNPYNISGINVSNNENYDNDDMDYDDEINKENDIREIWKKLKILEHKLHINNVSDKKSACFWCTHDFDNPPVYIPKYFINGSYHVYGCFCSPECGVGHLMEENIDSSVKFERYQLMNHIYSKIYNYMKNIKGAPSPFYTLDKFYGNLTIQEYRSLFKNDRLFLVVDKPLTRVMPELHEDNDDFIINNKIIPSNAFQIKKKSFKKNQTKNSIVNEKFGISQ